MVCTGSDYRSGIESVGPNAPAFEYYKYPFPDCCINYTALSYIFGHENVLPPRSVLLGEASKRLLPVDLVYLITHAPFYPPRADVNGNSEKIWHLLYSKRKHQEMRLVSKLSRPSQLGWSSIEALSSETNVIKFSSNPKASTTPVLRALSRLDVGEFPKFAIEVFSANDVSSQAFNLVISNRLFRSAILSQVLHSPGVSYVPEESRSVFEGWLVGIIKELHLSDSPRALMVLQKIKGKLPDQLLLKFTKDYAAQHKGKKFDIHLFALLRNSQLEIEIDPFKFWPKIGEAGPHLSAAFQASLGHKTFEPPSPQHLLEIFQSPESTLYSLMLRDVVLPAKFHDNLRDPMLVDWSIRLGFIPRRFSKEDYLDRFDNHRYQEDWIQLDKLYSYLKLIRASR